jgi:rod shape-determining protein MreB
MLAHFIKKAHNRTMWVRPRIVIGVPSEITQVEKRAVKDSAYRAKASEVYLVEEAMAAAIGAGMPIEEASGNMVVDIGGGTTDIAVISLAGIVYSKAIRVAGNEMDDAIIQYIKKTYNLLIGERTAEQIKMELGSAFPLDDRITMEIKGRHLIEGVPKTITISDEEIREALAETCSRTSTSACAKKRACQSPWPRTRSRPSCSAPARCCRISNSSERSRSTRQFR